LKKDQVPQDNTGALQGQRKALYAVDDRGRYGVTASSGWEAEALVLDQAIEQYGQLCAAARRRVEQGLSSALEYHMYRQRMDVTILAQSTGFFKWQIRRHFKPGIFSRLTPAQLARYVDALGIAAEDLPHLPPGNVE
jgi:hypothetical protein